MTRSKLVPSGPALDGTNGSSRRSKRDALRGHSPRLRHERDESADKAQSGPRDAMKRAKRNLDAGLVDTDLRNSPGMDAEQRRRLLKGQRTR
jgi:hypothetical protein